MTRMRIKRARERQNITINQAPRWDRPCAVGPFHSFIQSPTSREALSKIEQHFSAIKVGGSVLLSKKISILKCLRITQGCLERSINQPNHFGVHRPGRTTFNRGRQSIGKLGWSSYILQTLCRRMEKQQSCPSNGP